MTNPDERTVEISDPADHRLDEFRTLNDQRLRRRLEGDEFFIVEGYVAIDRLLTSGHVVRSVLLAPSRVERFAGRLDHPSLRGVPVYVAERGVIADVVGFDLHRGVIASATRQTLPPVDSLIATANRIAVLEGLNDAENVGAISRAALALGLDGLVIDATCTDPYSRRTVRVSMGEVLHLQVARAPTDEWPAVLDRVLGRGLETWAMTPAGDAEDLWTLRVPDRLAVVFGAEGPGLSAAALARCARRVRIPIRADVDSLNVAHAAAITFAALGRPTRGGSLV